MKKILLGIFGLTLLLPLGVNAETIDSVEEGSNSVDKDVTVGQVDIPVYQVEINWYSMIFEWKYTGDKYEWMVEPTCKPLSIDSEESYTAYVTTHGTLYDDEFCGSTSNYYDGESDYYYSYTPTEDGSTTITIVDKTTSGRVVPSISWQSSSDYEYVKGIFSYKNLESGNDEVLTEAEIPDSAMVYGTGWPRYEIKLKLQNKEKPTKTPTIGDTIGTITISISAAE